MDINKAYKVLGCSSNTSEEELKKIYRNLAIANHPDKGGDANKMKEINEAYQFIQDYKKNPQKHMPRQSSPFGFNIEDFFGNMNQEIELQKPPHIHINISFEEAVKGCEKVAEYDRNVRCNSCNGEGFIKLNNGCDKCGGQGRIVSGQNGMTFIQTCPKCYGKVNKKDCDACDSNGYIKDKMSGMINVPAGIGNGQTLRLSGMGHYMGSNAFGMHSVSDAFITIHYEKDPEISIEGRDVVSSIDIPLLDALRGVEKSVRTIYGDKNITIPAKAKNKDEISIEGCGVGFSGKHRVILNVMYPENVDNIIKSLE